jgi:pimeloyl-ACP methyl ester carboxylesterase
MLYRFGDYELDADRHEFRARGQSRVLEPQVFDLIRHLIENHDRLVSRDELIAVIWKGRIVSESTIDARIHAARKAVDDDGRRQARIKTVRKRGYRFTEEVKVLRGNDRDEYLSERATQPKPVKTSDVQQGKVKFCTTLDGVNIAYTVVGKGPPLVKSPNWMHHLELDWQSPIWSHLLRALSANHSLLRFDQRCNGLSDWDVPEVTFDSMIDDLATVVDVVGWKRFALLGISQGCAISIAYAVRNPERVSRLILYGGSAIGSARSGSDIDRQQREAQTQMILHGWGKNNPAFRQFFTSLFIPGATKEQMDWFNELQRTTISPENAVRLREATGSIDVENLLGQISVPTLVLHCRDDAVIPFEKGRRMATMIPDARFVALEGRNHLILEDEPAWPRFMKEVSAFLAQNEV